MSVKDSRLCSPIQSVQDLVVLQAKYQQVSAFMPGTFLRLPAIAMPSVMVHYL